MADDARASQLAASTRLPNDPDRIRALEDRVLNELRDSGYPEASAFAVRLALEEAVTNGFKHGHNRRGDLDIGVAWSITPERVVIEVADQGPGFDLGDVPDPRLPENLERPSGRGIMLMRAYMTTVEFLEPGNRVRMTYDNPAPPAHRSRGGAA